MQFIPAVFTSIFSAGSAAAGAGAAAGTGAAIAGSAGGATMLAGGSAAAAGGLGSLFSGSTFATILQGGASLIGAMSKIREGQSISDAYKLQAGQADADAAHAQIEGEQRQNSLRKSLVAHLGDQDAAYAASGLDLSFGTATTARDQAITDAGNALSADLGNEADQKSRFVQRASALRRMASQARSAGRLSGIGDLLETGVDMLQRG